MQFWLEFLLILYCLAWGKRNKKKKMTNSTGNQNYIRTTYKRENTLIGSPFKIHPALGCFAEAVRTGGGHGLEIHQLIPPEEHVHPSHTHTHTHKHTHTQAKKSITNNSKHAIHTIQTVVKHGTFPLGILPTTSFPLAISAPITTE